MFLTHSTRGFAPPDESFGIWLVALQRFFFLCGLFSSPSQIYLGPNTRPHFACGVPLPSLLSRCGSLGDDFPYVNNCALGSCAALLRVVRSMLRVQSLSDLLTTFFSPPFGALEQDQFFFTIVFFFSERLSCSGGRRGRIFPVHGTSPMLFFLRFWQVPTPAPKHFGPRLFSLVLPPTKGGGPARNLPFGFKNATLALVSSRLVLFPCDSSVRDCSSGMTHFSALFRDVEGPSPPNLSLWTSFFSH